MQFFDRIKLFSAPLGESLRRARGLPRSAWGMTVAHAGVGVFMLGLTVSGAWEQEKLTIINPGDSVDVGAYHFTLAGVSDNVPGSNFTAMQGTLDVYRDGKLVTVLKPEVKHFTDPPMDTTQAAIHTMATGDLYVVIGNSQSGGYAVRIYVKPLVKLDLGGRADHGPGRRPVLVGPASPGRRAGAKARRSREGGPTCRISLDGPDAAEVFSAPAPVRGSGRGARRGPDPESVPGAAGDRRQAGAGVRPAARRRHDPAPRLADLKQGKVTIVNIFASWCAPCHVEHPFLMELKEKYGVTIYGIDYKDDPTISARFLDTRGDPYAKVGADLNGRVGIDWGASKYPENPTSSTARARSWT